MQGGAGGCRGVQGGAGGCRGAQGDAGGAGRRRGAQGSRPLAGTPKTVPITHEADGWYIAISCAGVPGDALPPTGQETGIDLGLESFATRVNGECIFTPAYARKAEAHGRRCQRPARCPSGDGQPAAPQGGCAARPRASAYSQPIRSLFAAYSQPIRSLFAAYSQPIRRQRTDFHHKTALALVRAYDTIGHEAVRVAQLVQNHSVAKRIRAAGWSAFLTRLAFTAASAGKRVVAVDPAFTSQRWSGCGVVVQKGLSVRWHFCPECAPSLQRDQNAARNILRLGHSQEQKRPGYSRQASTWPVGPSVAENPWGLSPRGVSVRDHPESR
jgi:putative transposase